MSKSGADTLLDRLQRLEDIEAIGRLRYRYCEYCDQGFMAEEIAALFTPEGVWEASGDYGRQVGRVAIAKFFKSVSVEIKFSVHSCTNPIIDIDGDKASARWRAVIPASIEVNGRLTPHWLFNNYADSLQKIDGQWFFTHMRSTIARTASHSEGWD